MKKIKLNISNVLLILTVFVMFSCKKEVSAQTNTTSNPDKDYYAQMKSQVLSEDDSEFSGTEVDNTNYNPLSADATTKLVDKGSTYDDGKIQITFDTRSAEELNGSKPEDKITIGDVSFTRDLHNVTLMDVQNLEHNLEDLQQVKSDSQKDGSCSGKDCPVFAHVNKNEQKLYLYLNGEILDTFDTSSARKGYKTPDFNKKPDGRMYKKYSSHKYPGGSWNGLGNMPYAVFIEGGYAIHGATSGEIKELGHPASHGCIRVHPKNAKIFYNLVKYAGAENTWVQVTED